jgi:UDP-N-acetyl-D-glucosamine dehydrogenase
MVELAEEINGAAPLYVAHRLQGALNEVKLAVNGARVLLVGVTYKPDVSDLRQSPSAPLADRLSLWGADVAYHDARVPVWTRRPGDPSTRLESVPDLYAAAADADAVVLPQPHAEYDLARLASASQLLLDTRGVVADGPAVLRL